MKDIRVLRSFIPRQEDIVKWPHLADLDIPDLDMEIGLIIGYNSVDTYRPIELRPGSSGTPFATKTKLGWVVWGLIKDPDPHSRPMCNFIASSTTTENLENLVATAMKFDFPEGQSEEKQEMSVLDKQFMSSIESSLKLKDGHYEIGLPLRENCKLPNNRNMALKSLMGLKSKFRADGNYHDQYKLFVSDMIRLGYAEVVPVELSNDESVWYLPHHGVYHPQKPNKVRVVFDASAKFQGIALNDVLLQGPDVTNSLIGVLHRFREGQVALKADIENMFFQVRVPENDRDFLRFLWFEDGDIEKGIVSLRMKVHMFGAVSSPACANIALQRTATDNAAKFSTEIVKSIARNFYVDDFLKCPFKIAESEELAVSTQNICRKGGFNLTKWSSNKSTALNSIPPDDRVDETKQEDSVLGLK
ncbi:uncharacterized protein LOC141911526 [Tubulanus polymorphus]|uniref:uncharacterized protein LOC141911526 n=1 Tax=Tubulanus polymorphus TaxID=672921 RepID=UPI003DA4FAC1